MLRKFTPALIVSSALFSYLAIMGMFGHILFITAFLATYAVISRISNPYQWGVYS